MIELRQSPSVTKSLSIDVTHQTLACIAKASRAAGRPAQEWLAHAVELSASLEGDGFEAPWDEASMELFATIAGDQPGYLQGRWARLYQLVNADPTLWREHHWNVAECEDGNWVPEPPVIDLEALRQVWSQLVLKAFVEHS